MSFKVVIGNSQEWDPEKAIRNCLSNLGNESGDPSFLLFFSTIHYKKNNGFKRMLNLVYSTFSDSVPLIGGTVAGFMNNFGVYTRGVMIVACYSDKIKVELSRGSGLKSNPKKAVSKLVSGFKNSIANDFLFVVNSGGKVPFIPFLKQGRAVNSKIIGRIESFFLPYILKYFQFGVGREEEALQELKEITPSANIFSIATMDNNNMETNFQFYNKEITTNEILALKVSSDYEFFISTVHGLQETPIKFKITDKSKDSRVIKKLNGKSAKEEFLSSLGWPKEYINEQVYKKVFFYPLLYKKDGIGHPFIAGLFLGDNIIPTIKVDDNNLCLMSTSGKLLLGVVDEVLDKIPRKPKFIIIAECGIRCQTLGKGLFKVREKIINKFGPVPFISLYVGAEGTYSPNTGVAFGSDTFNIIAFL